MSLLAQVKRKQVISVNPQGKNEASEWQEFGKKLMEKSGWQHGDGLGSARQGSKEFIQMSFKDDNRGLGCSLKYEQNWLAHNDDFNALLSSLNQSHGESSAGKQTQPGETDDQNSFTVERTSLEEKSKSSRKRIHYQKFARGKDLSSRSTDDISKIFGGKMPQKQITESAPHEAATDGEEPTHGITGLNTIKSKDSIHEYFARKMASKRKPDLQATETVIKPDPDQLKHFSSEDGVHQNHAHTNTKKSKKNREKVPHNQVDHGEVFLSEIRAALNTTPADPKEASVDSGTNPGKKKRKDFTCQQVQSDEALEHSVVGSPKLFEEQTLEESGGPAAAAEESEFAIAEMLAEPESTGVNRQKKKRQTNLVPEVASRTSLNDHSIDETVEIECISRRTRQKRKRALDVSENAEAEGSDEQASKNYPQELSDSVQLSADCEGTTETVENLQLVDIIRDGIADDKPARKKKRHVEYYGDVSTEYVPGPVKTALDGQVNTPDGEPVTVVSEKKTLVISTQGTGNSADVLAVSRQYTRTAYGPTMAGIRQHFRNLAPEVKAGIYLGSNIFDVAGYGDDLLY